MPSTRDINMALLHFVLGLTWRACFVAAAVIGVVHICRTYG